MIAERAMIKGQQAEFPVILHASENKSLHPSAPALPHPGTREKKLLPDRSFVGYLCTLLGDTASEEVSGTD